MTRREFWWFFGVLSVGALETVRRNLGWVLFILTAGWFALSLLVPSAWECRKLGGKPDLDFSCYKLTKEIIKVP